MILTAYVLFLLQEKEELSVYNHRMEGWQQHMYELSILF